MSSGDERDPRARSPSQERTRRKDKYTIHDYNFIKVLGKGSFGKVRAKECFSIYIYIFGMVIITFDIVYSAKKFVYN